MANPELPKVKRELSEALEDVYLLRERLREETHRRELAEASAREAWRVARWLKHRP